MTIHYRLYLIFIYFCLCLSGAEVFAQERPVYPEPVLTPEIKALLDSRRVWRPHTTRSTRELPVGIDNSRTKYFPPIFNQKGNSCSQAASIGYLFTYEMNRLLDRDASSRAHQFSYLYTWNFLNDGEDNGSFAASGLALTRVNGVMNQVDFPILMSVYRFYWMSGYDKYIDAMHYRTKEILKIPLETTADIVAAKEYLADGGCFTISAYTSGWKIDDYYEGPSATGYKSLLTRLAADGAHAMTVVGYDDLVTFSPAEGDTTHGAFIVVNSWGTFSHDNGRYYLPYYFFTIPRAENQLGTEGTGAVVEYHEPKVVFKVKLAYSSRDDLKFTLGVADKAYAETPTITYDSPTMNYQGGNHPLPGAKSFVSEPYSLEVAFNFTDYIEQYTSYTAPKYFLNILRRADRNPGEGYIEHFSVIDYRYTPAREYVCTDIDSTTLNVGSNLFSISTIPARTTSASPLNWIEKGKPSEKTHIIRTAAGGYAKVDFIDYDAQTGKATIHYLYQPSGNNLSSYE
ncbi:MAG: C1 family peptidase [Coprobacter sp.]|nr:C1 family peptidase [Coprobacter sp.]